MLFRYTSVIIISVDYGFLQMPTILLNTPRIKFSDRTWQVAIRAVAEAEDVQPVLYLTNPKPEREDGKNILPITVYHADLETPAEHVWLPNINALGRLFDQLVEYEVIDRIAHKTDKFFHLTCHELHLNAEQHMLLVMDYIERRARHLQEQWDEPRVKHVDEKSFHSEQRRTVAFAFYESLLGAKTLRVDARETEAGYTLLHKIHDIPVAVLDVEFKETDSTKRMEVTASCDASVINEHFPNSLPEAHSTH